MAEKMKKEGYGQVEPNRLSAQLSKEVCAQLPADSALTVIENGMALVYDQAAGKVRLVNNAEKDMVCLVMNEIILEDERYQEDKDFAQLNRPETKHQTAIAAYPRVYGLHVGDTFTTNTIMVADQETPLTAGAKYVAGTNGYWEPVSGETNARVVLAVVKDYTMPDGQRGIKFVVEKVA